MNKSESKYFNTAMLMNQALLLLLDQKDIEHITVKEICEKAGVQAVLHIGTDGGFRQVCHKSDTGRETGLFRLIVLWQ